MRHSLSLVAVALAAACGPERAPPNELAAPAVTALTAANAGGGGDVAPLFTEGALLVDGDARFEGAAAVSGQLAGQGLTLASAVDSHHDVLRARVTRGDDELLLFGAIDGDGKFTLVVLVAPPADGDGSNGSDPITAYQAAWNEPESAARVGLLEDCWSDDGRYVDPTADVSGRAALDEHIGGFIESLPGAAIEGKSDVVEGGRAVHFRWLTKGMAGLVSIEGMDVGLVDDTGKLTLIAGFFGPLAPLPGGE